MKFWSSSVGLLISFTPMVSSAVDLRPETVSVWEQYIGTVDGRLKATSAAGGAFLWIGAVPGRAERVQRGEVLVSQIRTDTTKVPHGLIHDWVGGMFVANATMADALALARDYERYPEWYGPTVNQASLLERSSDEDRFKVRYVRTALFVTVVLDAEYQTRYYQLDSTRWYSISRSLRIQEIHDYGRANERRIPADDGSGYLSRIYSVSRYEQRDNGVYIEQENIALSRGIPASLRWMIEPVVRRLSRDLLTKTLQQTRAAVRSRSRE